MYTYPAVFERNDDGSYTITFPDLPGCISEGKDYFDAVRMAEDALRNWLICLRDEGETFPRPRFDELKGKFLCNVEI